MKLFKVLSTVIVCAFFAQSANAAEPYPLEYFALRDVVSNVTLSPNGKKLALLKIPTRDGDPILEIYETENMSKKPFRISADPMEIQNYFWISDEDIVFNARQRVTDKIDGFNQGAYRFKAVKVDLRKNKLKEFKNSRLRYTLPNKPNKVLVTVFDGEFGNRSASAFEFPKYYELNLKTGAKKLVIEENPKTYSFNFDRDGKPRFASGRDSGTKEWIDYIRRKGSNKWEEIYRVNEMSYESFRIVGFDPDNENMAWVIAHNGRDTTGLWEFDINTKKFGELIYARNDVNVDGVRRHSNVWKSSDITAVSYSTDKNYYEYFDEVEGATYAQLEKLLPASHDVYITSRSRDGNTLTVYNVGPRDPGTYYLLKDGKLETIGSKQPLLDSDKLADVKYISWKARDGKKIRGYLTVPNGKGPFPLVVLPHGGPFVSEVVSYDEWGQVLANNGYMVLQPQYRGSTHYGLDFYHTAFMNGGQGGYQMQDDKDDGALYLVKKGLVDPERIAMFGWSYGGYAALVAGSREDQIYQCTIAGAAVADNIQQLNYFRDKPLGRGGFTRRVKEEQVKMWTKSISPINEVEKVNIPMLVIHGDIDQRVPVTHSRKYVAKLKAHGKEHKYIELKGADHFSNTLFYNHQIELYTNMIDYLKNDCGPGGL